MKLHNDHQPQRAEMVQSASLSTPDHAHNGRALGHFKAARHPLQAQRGERVSLSPAARMAPGQHILEGVIRDKLEAKFGHGGFDLRTAMQDKVATLFEKYGIDPEVAKGLDPSAGATAQRIFDMTTALLGTFADQHPELDGVELIDSFEDVMRGGVDEGYGEAIEILQAMDFGDLTDGILSTAAETKSILDGLFDDYFARMREAREGGDAGGGGEQSGEHAVESVDAT